MVYIVQLMVSCTASIKYCIINSNTFGVRYATMELNMTYPKVIEETKGQFSYKILIFHCHLHWVRLKEAVRLKDNGWRCVN